VCWRLLQQDTSVKRWRPARHPVPGWQACRRGRRCQVRTAVRQALRP
jgi:hypothetical protein